MAYTKAPVSDTHNTQRIPAIGSPFVVSDTNAEVPISLNYINCYPEKENQWGTDPKRSVRKKDAFDSVNLTGSLTTLGTNGRSTVLAANLNKVFFTRHSQYYMADFTTNVLSSVTTSTTATLAQTAHGTNAVDATNAPRIAYLDAVSELKTFLEDGTSVTTTSLVANTVDGSKGLQFINGYLFAVSSDGYRIYNSVGAGNLTSWPTNNFIAAEQYADPTVFIEKHRNFLVAFGKQSTEFFYDNGIEIGSPLARQESYASRIGLDTSGGPGRATARIEEDIYFIGASSQNTKSLYRLRDFRISEIQGTYLNDILNFQSSATNTNALLQGLETIQSGNTAMICINFSTGASLVYHPDEDMWWQLLPDSGLPNPSLRSTVFFVPLNRQPMFIGELTAMSGTARLHWATSDLTVTSTIYSEVMDFGISFYKHIAEVTAIGDYGLNTLTLSFNKTADYTQPYTTCTPTRTPSVDGYEYPSSWYNLGGMVRFSFKLEIAGVGPALHDGLDITYNVGTS